MSRKLTTAIFLALSLMLIWSLANATAEEKPQKNIEVQIHELQEQIQELESALERESNEEKAKELKAALEDRVKKLDILRDEFPQPKKSKWMFPEIHLGIEQTKGHLAELEHTLEVLQDEGAKPEMREAIRKKIAQKEAHLEELTAHLEKRTAEQEKKLEDKEVPIRGLKAQIKELEQALKRVSSDERAAELKAALKRNVNKLEELMMEFHQKPKWEFAELQIAIERTRGHLNGLREAVEVLKEEGAEPKRLKEMIAKIGKTEDELLELTAHLEQRRAEAERKKAKGRTKLVIISLKHANAVNLSEVIENFLTPSGVISADPDTNSLVIRDAPAGLETARVIIKELDVGEKMRERGERRRRGERDMPRRERDRPRREGIITGKVIEAGKEGLTLESEGEKVTFYVPLRRKEDEMIPFEELSHHVSSLKIGSKVKVQWVRGDDSEKLWIRRVLTGEPRFTIGKVIKAGEKGLTIETGEGKVTFYVPLRKRDDGTLTPSEELSHYVASLKVGSKVKVQWIRGEDPKKPWIRKVEKVEK